MNKALFVRAFVMYSFLFLYLLFLSGTTFGMKLPSIKGVSRAGVSAKYCTLAQSSLPKELAQLNGIYPYHDAYKAKIHKIALENIHFICSVPLSSRCNTPAFSEQLVQNQVIPTLTDSKVTSKVYLKDGQPVGFITYSTHKHPWHRMFTPIEVGPNAEIYHLAVDKQHRKKGYAQALVKNALQDCKDKSVNRVSLWTTGPGFDLESFYSKFGFIITRQTKFFEREYALRLQPHPVWKMSTLAFYGAQKKVKDWLKVN